MLVVRTKFIAQLARESETREKCEKPQLLIDISVFPQREREKTASSRRPKPIELDSMLRP